MVCSQNKFCEKVAFSLDLRVLAGMTSLSVGNMIVRRPGADGSEIHTWKAPRPYSAYLYGFAVGRLTRVSERVGSKRLTYLSNTRSEEHTSELQSLMRISYAVFCLKTKNNKTHNIITNHIAH